MDKRKSLHTESPLKGKEQKRSKTQGKKQNLTKQLDELMHPQKIDVNEIQKKIIDIIDQGLQQSNKAIQVQSIYALQAQMPNVMKEQQFTENVFQLAIHYSGVLTGSKAEQQVYEIILTLSQNPAISLSVTSYTSQNSPLQEIFYQECSFNLKDLKKIESQ
ncbi:UNKNOWN [Stylonychia lemnae]|uniref:Uncharacterized protein n=1 Tax=Stylonychia lemnae TaxID=5949 RepID=A0A078A896_STYLE|nr:UNKNOWN [Stylonychia lemnae]|eukprot:CDW78480.1 UNKNOWN [Stylonychia lemnae]